MKQTVKNTMETSQFLFLLLIIQIASSSRSSPYCIRLEGPASNQTIAFVRRLHTRQWILAIGCKVALN